MSKQFSQLGIIEPLTRSLEESNISIPTDIQQKIIPLFLKEKKDLVGLAKTGTGKTAAFGLPLLQLVDQDQPYIQGVILAPT
ncbi:DEAD/DEAH box helicase, partial [Lutimonas sp.]|uniref:DEAD/DEAH box helicase n=1 Tax=Lutimonas sp. TaxID=1872403 RepID=UPI003C710188